jgi:hypothetical protein
VIPRVRLWAALSAGAAVFIGCGVFFALQNLGTANDYATIASFFLALVTAVWSLVSLTRSKQEKESGDLHRETRQPRHISMLFAWKNGMVNQGNIEHIDIWAPPHQEKKTRKPGFRAR